jgi:hypothetical protein
MVATLQDEVDPPRTAIKYTAVIQKDRGDCPGFVKYRIGHSPKEHQEVMYQAEMMKFQDEQRQKDYTFQDDQRIKDRDFQERIRRSDRYLIIVSIAVSSIVALLAAFLGAFATWLLTFPAK